jgi:hypothetical protein
MAASAGGRVEAGMRLAQTVSIASADGSVSLSFDLSHVEMTDEQAVIVHKLFSQHPTALVAVEDHLHAQERGKHGPGADYLEFAEFERIRELGVRLGTKGDLVATACDFCLHCVKLEATPTWRGGLEAGGSASNRA